MANFLKAADLEDIKEGRMHAVEVDGELICLAKVEGTICAFTDNCTHISGPLSGGMLSGYVVTCPWHGAQFDIRTGKAVRGPARQDLVTYPVKIQDNDVLVDLPPE